MVFSDRVRKKSAAAAVTFAVCIAISGCSGSTDVISDDVSQDARDIADEYFPGDRNSLAAWKDVDPNKIIASVDIPEHIPELDITFDDFFNEYMYYLAAYGIEDDMSEDNSESCKSYRVNIINYLTFEKMFLYVADTEYGINEQTLTEEQIGEVRSNADSVRSDWEMNFYDSASAKLGEDAATEDIEELCGEVLDVIFDKCGIDRDLFYEWELSSMIEQLALEKLLDSVEVSDDEVREQLSELREQAKNAAESDPAAYEGTPSYAMSYIPDGTRIARHIAVPLGEDGYTIELQKKAEEIADKLAAGEDFEELMGSYDGTDEHIVLRNSVNYSSAYINALYGIKSLGGVSIPLTDGGSIYIIQYLGDAQVSDEDAQLLEEQMRSYLKNKDETNVQIEAYNEWSEKYSYNIDCETLRVDPSDIIQYGVTSEGIIG